MLSKIFLTYADEDLNRRYKASRQEFYTKAYPLITALLFALAIAIEIVFRGVKAEELSLSPVTSVINWGYFVLFLVFSRLIRRWAWPAWLVCPLLTVIVYYYFAFVDFQKSAAVLYFT